VRIGTEDDVAACDALCTQIHGYDRTAEGVNDNLPGHFLSFAEWDNPEQSRAWKRLLLGSRSGARPAQRCATRPRGADYDRVATV
jgi:hypothetical protein